MKLALVLSTAFLVGWADVAPEPDSVDAHCSLEEQCAGGTFCSYQNNAEDPSVAEATEACRNAAKAKGFEHRCTDGGGTVGRQLFCPKGETGTWSQGCSRCSVGDRGALAPVGAPLGALAACVGLALARRYSKRRESGVGSQVARNSVKA
jgi:hypothetical protein